MFQFRSISARLILAISMIIAVTCCVLGAFSVFQQRSLTRLALDQLLKVQYDSVIAALDYEGRAALAVGSVIAALPPVETLTAAGDRDALMRLLGGAQVALNAQGMPFLNITLPPATIFLRVHDPKVFGDDISGRRKTVVAASETGKPVVGVEPGRSTIGIFAITPILHDGKSVAVIDMGVTVGKEFLDRAKQRFGVDLAVHMASNGGFTTLGSTFGETTIATSDELKRAFGGETPRRDVTMSGHPAALYVGQVRNYAGEPVAVIELLKDTTAYQEAAANAQRDLILGTVAILIIGIAFALFLGRSLSRPVTAITATMNRLSSGDTAVTIPDGARKDELGSMAIAVQVFKDNMIEGDKLRAEQELSKKRVEADRRATMLGLADRFESGIGGIVRGVGVAATELQTSAQAMARR